ncbi:MAG TPA: hypothetical protein VGQ30_14010 [Gemmatimonadaceae bacterium]|jgi:hypothetical protein|nr:hypothetical protein [Gemmatimonadaceae bacterium]
MMRASRSFGLRTSVFGLAMLFGVAAANGQAVMAKPADSTRADAAKRAERGDGMIPAGFGTLRQDQIAIRLQANGLTVSAVPLEESVIRTLAPDSYRSLRAYRESKKAALDALRARNGLASVQVWWITFFNVQQGDARFDAFDVLIHSVGQDFRPLDALPLTPGFGDGRVAQRGQQSAVYAFDPQIDLNQPLTFASLGQSTTVWGDVTAPLIERERAAIWSRAAAAKP